MTRSTLWIALTAVVVLTTTHGQTAWTQESGQPNALQEKWSAFSELIASDEVFQAERLGNAAPPISAWWSGAKGSFWAVGDEGEAYYLFEQGQTQYLERYKLKFDGFRMVSGRLYATFYEVGLNGGTEYKDYQWAFPYFPYPPNIGLPAKHKRPSVPEYRHSFVYYTSIPTNFPVIAPAR